MMTEERRAIELACGLCLCCEASSVEGSRSVDLG